MATLSKITPCLWFDTQAEDAANFYTGIFPNSRVVNVSHYGSAGPRPEGMVMVVDFELEGQSFVALNGGPEFTFNEAISFQVSCESQEEVDDYWTKLTDGGQEVACGWLKDRFGVAWQIVPTVLDELVRDPDPERSQRAMKAMMAMTKFDIAELRRAADG
ncbi:MAG TPA: VOC family protein [Acidimicrobiales bacterium]|nr:VOC family protein [Acidimicrobiales bacterium]